MKKISHCLLAILFLCGSICTTGCTDDAVAAKPVIYLYPDAKDEVPEEPCEEKPVIYCYPDDEILYEKPILYHYPESTTEITVRLDYNGKLTHTYPAYRDGWTVLARPDGILTDPATGREYYCLFWEGVSDIEYDFSEGFCVPGEDTAAFLEDALAKLGLSEREANEFIIYWLPRMEKNPYNRIAFQTDIYTDNAVLTVEPAPDTMIRVFMAWQPLTEPVEIEPQTLTAPERTGFVVVEWGGTEIQ